jgi:hypothetical protein
METQGVGSGGNCTTTTHLELAMGPNVVELTCSFRVMSVATLAPRNSSSKAAKWHTSSTYNFIRPYHEQYPTLKRKQNSFFHPFATAQKITPSTFLLKLYIFGISALALGIERSSSLYTIIDRFSSGPTANKVLIEIFDSRDKDCPPKRIN